MILINLLPHREAARKRRREIFYAALWASAVGGLVIAGGIWLWYSAQISSQQNRNEILSAEIKKLEAQIKDIASLQEEIAALRARQQAVEDLQADRNMPVYLLSELVKQLPDGVYLSSMKQNGQLVSLVGTAQSNERVSELLRNLSSNSPWLTRPELQEIVAGNVNLSPRDARRVANFRMTVRLVRAAEAQKAASAAASAGVVPTAAGPGGTLPNVSVPTAGAPAAAVPASGAAPGAQTAVAVAKPAPSQPAPAASAKK